MRIQICRPDGADIYMPSDGYKYVDPTGLQTWRPRVLSEPLFISYCFVNFISESLQKKLTFYPVMEYYFILTLKMVFIQLTEKIFAERIHIGWLHNTGC